MNISEKIHNFGVVILAAGRGTRLHCDDLPKVMLDIGDKPIVSYIIDTLFKIGFQREQICLAVGFHKEKVMDYFADHVLYAIQDEPLGTAHAAYTGMKVLPEHLKQVLVINGDDSAFYQSETIINFINSHLEYGAMASLLSAEIDASSFAYGRIIKRGNEIEIIEKEYLTADNKDATKTSTGTFCLNRDWFVGVFPNMPVIEKLGEYGLPTAFMMAQKEGLSAQVVKLENNKEWFGINTKEELREADQRMRALARDSVEINNKIIEQIVKKSERKFMTGSEVAVEAAIDAGAEMMYGYPITPATEVFTGWINRGQKYLQTEDEIAAGFAVCGAVLAGQKAFTATSGPGHILMQDGLSMAEGMRLPFVMIVAQRGGPSSGTVIYSQQEVILACFGGNGEGLRLVYSPASLQEVYTLTRRAFNDAWRYRFPAIVLTDGYMLKTRGVVDLADLKAVENVSPHPLVPEDKVIHWPNIYTFEEELHEQIVLAQEDFDKIAPEIVAFESYQIDDAEILLMAHGIVAACAKEAVDELRKQGKKVGLFRPITLRPFPKKELDKVSSQLSLKKIVVVESSAGQLARVVRDQLAPEISVPFAYLQYPGLGVETEEIVGKILHEMIH